MLLVYYSASINKVPYLTLTLLCNKCYINHVGTDFEETSRKDTRSERKQGRNRRNQVGKNDRGSEKKEARDGQEFIKRDSSFNDRRNVEQKNRDVQRHDSHEHGNALPSMTIVLHVFLITWYTAKLLCVPGREKSKMSHSPQGPSSCTRQHKVGG